MTMSIQGISTQGSILGLNNLSEGSTDPSGVTGDVDDCGALLPAPSVVTGGSGDIGAEIALLSVQAGQDEQRIDATSENTENNVQDAAEQSEVTDMRTEAHDIMSSAWAAGAMQMCQGAIQIAGAGASADASPSSAPGGGAWSSALTGGASLCGAGATIFSAQGQALTQLDQANVTGDKAVADRAGQTSTEASQGQSDARSVISNAIQFYQEYQRTAAQTDLTAAGQRA